MTDESAIAGFGCGCQSLVLIIFGLIGGMCSQYTLEHWLPLVAHHTVHVPFILAIIIGFFTGPIMILAAIITYLIS